MVTKFLYKKSYSQLPQMHRFCSANALAQHLYHRIDYTELTLNKEPTSAAVRSAKIWASVVINCLSALDWSGWNQMKFRTRLNALHSYFMQKKGGYSPPFKCW